MLGHKVINGRSNFRVWANKQKELKIKFTDTNEIYPMKKEKYGYFTYISKEVEEGRSYAYILDDGLEVPDPTSLSLPNGVHGDTKILSNVINKEKSFKGIDLRDAIIYEMHIGTFSPSGDFKGAIEKIPYLSELGINVVEVMPVAAWAGDYNWGYDGVYQYAVHESYGGLQGFKEFINECNKVGIGVILDLVYNHFGPEGNYLGKFAGYFTNKYHTPWGSAINFEGRYGKQVREYFLENARFWLEDIGLDGFRMDAVHEIYDFSHKHLLEDIWTIAKRVEEQQERSIFIVSENAYHTLKSEHDVKLDGHWGEDFHHSIHSYLSGETNSYLSKYGKFEDIAEVFKKGYCTEFWRNNFYSNPESLIVSIQTHDQVGNRPYGDRLHQFISFEEYKLAAVAMFASPFTPMLFSGEEFMTGSPFYFFCDFGDEHLKEAIRKGRIDEFGHKIPKEDIVDPCSKDAFEKSKLNFDNLTSEKNKEIFDLYRTLIEMKKNEIIGIRDRRKIDLDIDKEKKTIRIKNTSKNTLTILNFGNKEFKVEGLKDHKILLGKNNDYIAPNSYLVIQF